MRTTTNQKSNRTIIFISISIVLSMILIGILCFVKTTGYGTGLYTRFSQASTEQHWQLNGGQALTAGSFVRNAPISGGAEALTIDSSCAVGSLILRIGQGEKEELIDISNANGLVVPLDGFSSTQDIKLAVEHSKASDFQFDVSWE